MWEFTPSDKENKESKKSDREIVLEKRIADMEEKFRIFQANFQTNAPKSKGKGRGKKSSPNDTQFSEEVAREAQRRLRSFLQSSEPSTSISNADFEPSAPPLEAGYWTEDNSSVAGSQNSASIRSVPKVTATDKVYITSIEVTLNGTPIDQVSISSMFYHHLLR